MGYLNTSKRIKGKYRVLAHCDKETGQFIRDNDGRLEESFDDFYIPCKGGAHIYHFGYLEGNKRSVSANTLVAYFDNYVKAQTVIEKMEAKYPHIIPTCYVDMGGKFYKEAEIFFDPKYIDEFAEIMGAQTKGANISPFSVKNLPTTVPKRVFEPYSIGADYDKEQFQAYMRRLGLKMDVAYAKLFEYVSDRLGFNFLEKADAENYKPLHWLHKNGYWGIVLDGLR